LRGYVRYGDVMRIERICHGRLAALDESQSISNATQESRIDGGVFAKFTISR